MTEPENFLQRWARRKHQSGDPSKEPGEEPDKAEALDRIEPRPEVKSQADATPDETFDLSKLPSLESITSATDVRAFLQPGVPEALSRAALRRAWSADPVIRDFIGLSENSWDFTASDSMYGFGELDPADAKRLFAQLLGGGNAEKRIASTDDVAQDQADDAIQACGEGLDHVPAAGADQAPQKTKDDADEMLQDSISERGLVASQQEPAELRHEPVTVRRGHGRALPQ